MGVGRSAGAGGSSSVLAAKIQRSKLRVAAGPGSRQRAEVAHRTSRPTWIGSSPAASARNMSSSVRSSPSARSRADGPAFPRNHGSRRSCGCPRVGPRRPPRPRASRSPAGAPSTRRRPRRPARRAPPSPAPGRLGSAGTPTRSCARPTPRRSGPRPPRARTRARRSPPSPPGAADRHAPSPRSQPPCSATSQTPGTSTNSPSSDSRGRPLTIAIDTPGARARSRSSASCAGPGRASSGRSAKGMSVPSRSRRIPSGECRARDSQWSAVLTLEPDAGAVPPRANQRTARARGTQRPGALLLLSLAPLRPCGLSSGASTVPVPENRIGNGNGRGSGNGVENRWILASFSSSRPSPALLLLLREERPHGRLLDLAPRDAEADPLQRRGQDANAPSSARPISCVFEIACAPCGTTSASVQRILMPGSSKQGNAVRAAIDSNCVKA